MILCGDSVTEYDKMMELTVDEYLMVLDAFASKVENENSINRKLRSNRKK